MRALVIALAMGLAAIAAICGIPRLYGIGCANHPFGFALANEESDFTDTCARIAPIWE